MCEQILQPGCFNYQPSMWFIEIASVGGRCSWWHSSYMLFQSHVVGNEGTYMYSRSLKGK